MAAAQDWEERQIFVGDTPPSARLRILSSTDIALFEPVLTSFLARHPGVEVEYLVTSTALLDRYFRADPSAFDLVISSAMDLQLKLANDGFALRLPDVGHPDWAQWRQSVFAFTTEPAAIVLNRAAFAGQALPTTRQALIRALRADPETFRGKVGTYDVRASALGYLFATQDARASETFWRLTEVMGALDARLYCCSGEMIEDVAAGRLLVAYNVLGSYAAARGEIADQIDIVLPEDFPTTMMRTVFVSKQTDVPGPAIDFLRHVIAVQSADAGEEGYPLPPLGGPTDAARRSTIALEPALITHLDQLKRRTFLREWVSAIIQGP
jgi:iron(III) transport system substrate-binding protein